MARQLMRILFVWCFAIVGLSAETVEVKRILFIGNSYTGVNELPKIVGEIIKSAGHASPEIRSSTPGGRTLAQHCAIPETLALIDKGAWDVVVLQGHSMEAAQSEISEATRKSFLSSGKTLCDRIRKSSPKARILFYQTWSRHADYWKAKEADRSVGENPTEMIERIQRWYQKQAEANHAELVPVGTAWQLFYKQHDRDVLHVPDHSHPNFSGSYLAGLLFYAKIYRCPVKPVEYRGNLTRAQADDLVRTATEVLK